MAPAPRHRCFLDVTTGGRELGRITIELFSDVVPKTCANFEALCTGEAGIGKTTVKPLHYKGCKFHRVIKNFMVQAGDFSSGTGQGGESIYGGSFDDENFHFNHSEPFMLSMANRGKNTNGSQFFITTKPAKHLDGVHVVFGKVITGQEVVTAIEEVAVDKKARPLEPIVIADCGTIQPDVVSDSASEAGIADRKKKKKNKKDKKHKKHKKEKKQKREKEKKEDDGSVEDDDKIECSIDPKEVPEIPSNKFLYRESRADQDASVRNRQYRNQHQPAETFEGRKVKGRGALRFTRLRSRSRTPPHWRREQERLRPLSQAKTRDNRPGSIENKSGRRNRSPDSPDRWNERRDRRNWSRSRSRSNERGYRHRERSPVTRKYHGVPVDRKHEERTSDVESDFEQQALPHRRRLKSAVVHHEKAVTESRVTDGRQEDAQKDDNNS